MESKGFSLGGDQGGHVWTWDDKLTRLMAWKPYIFNWGTKLELPLTNANPDLRRTTCERMWVSYNWFDYFLFTYFCRPRRRVWSLIPIMIRKAVRCKVEKSVIRLRIYSHIQLQSSCFQPLGPHFLNNSLKFIRRKFVANAISLPSLSILEGGRRW